MKKPVIGILTWRDGTRFGEPGYFRRLIREGRELGAEVFLFAPHDVDRAGKRVRGFLPAARGGWSSRWFAWPDIVIDRYRYYPKPRHSAYLPFRKQNLFVYANNRMANKWKVHQVLSQDGEMRRWLPETKVYSRAHLKEMLDRHPLLYIKPSNGSGGRGILRVARKQGAYTVLGKSARRGKQVRSFHTSDSLADWVDRWVAEETWGRETYLIQQGLRIDLLPRRAVDVRLLIQKDETGAWTVTGLGVRVGRSDSATSNLHSGGRAEAAGPFLTSVFGIARADEIIRECHALALRTAEVIERTFGRMIELGLDIGVDKAGRVWLIEVNPKPGRDIFRELGDYTRYRMAVRRPIQYALHLIKEMGILRTVS